MTKHNYYRYTYSAVVLVTPYQLSLKAKCIGICAVINVNWVKKLNRIRISTEALEM